MGLQGKFHIFLHVYNRCIAIMRTREYPCLGITDQTHTIWSYISYALYIICLFSAISETHWNSCAYRRMHHLDTQVSVLC